MIKIDILKSEIKKIISNLEKLEEERLSCKDYAGALKRQSEREAYVSIWNLICNILDD